MKMGKEGSAKEEASESKAEAMREGDAPARKKMARPFPPRKMKGRK